MVVNLHIILRINIVMLQSIDRRTGSTNAAMTGVMERPDTFDSISEKKENKND